MINHIKKISILILVVFPVWVSAQSASSVLNSGTDATLATVVSKLVAFINALVPVIATAMIVFFFYGLVRFVRNSGDAKGRAVGRDAIVWSLIGLFVVFTLWGIVSFIQSAFSLPNTPATNQGTFPAGNKNGHPIQGATTFPTNNSQGSPIQGATTFPTGNQSGSSVQGGGGQVYVIPFPSK